ncbi:MAG: CBS domain-containing protein [Caldilineaceae bacterium]|nr:CBS domain-containing protein [Caldilineaceae bacterium]
MLVRDRMSSPAITVAPGESYHAALKLMQDKNAHHIPVVENNAVVGIVAERDLLLAAVNFMQADVDVAEIMHAPVVTIGPEASVIDAARIMAKNRIGGLPVVDGSGVVGIITETDVVNVFVAMMAD